MAHVHTAVKVEGGLFPGDFLRKLGLGDSSIPGLDAASYHLEGTRLHDAIAASWNTMRSRWSHFQTSVAGLPESDTATSLTRERFLLPLFAELQYGRLVPEKARVIDGNEYPISHYWRNSPIHLLGYRVPLDKRSPGVQGAARTSPHSLIQDYLNRTEAALWAFMSNGQTLRVLHDNKTMARPTFIEFDLVMMFETEAYSDFVLLWILCHESRVEAEDPYKCRLEQWVTIAREQGTRALDKLRHGVATALNELGQGFLDSEAGNSELRRALKEGTVSNLEYYRQVIRVVYRLMFLLAGEDRDLLFARDCDPIAKSTYLRFYSASRLREMAAKVYGTRHGDLWNGLKAIFGKLSDSGCPGLALPALNSFLWDPNSTSALNAATITNSRLLNAVRGLTYITEGSSRQRIDYKNIGAEEIGGIYENIIALSPHLDVNSFTFTLGAGAFSERDETASHYTPSSLVDELLNSALEPVLERASREKDQGAAILALKVCDRACGSGHFLVAAAKRMAKRLASVRTGEVEPSPNDVQKALRDVIAHCIYGVDLNPTAVELCKFSLWLESMDCGRPLSFLENRIKTGNALLGATPAAIKAGIPDDAFVGLSGDDKAVVAALRKQNKRERAELEQGQESLFSHAEILWMAWVEVKSGVERIIAIDDDAIEHIHAKQVEYDQLLSSDSYLEQRLVANAWCAAFFLPRSKGEVALTTASFAEIRNDPKACAPNLRSEIERIAATYRLFHWHLEFPEVFVLPHHQAPENEHCGWSGGFDVNLGNPPWDRIKFNEPDWFAERSPAIAAASTTSARKRLIAALPETDPELYHTFQVARRTFEGLNHFIRDGGVYPLGSGGELNLATLFAESFVHATSRSGQVGAVLPTTIITDKSAQPLSRAWLKEGRLQKILDFENVEKLFPGIDGRYKFALITLRGAPDPDAIVRAAFYLHSLTDAKNPANFLTLTPAQLALINPNTLSFPVSRSQRDALLLLKLHRRAGALKIDADGAGCDPWGFGAFFVFEMNKDSGRFTPEGGNGLLPMLEAKLIHQFDHRAATFADQSAKERDNGSARELTPEEHLTPEQGALPRFWVSRADVLAAFDRGRITTEWVPVVREITNSTNERTVICSIIPRVGMGHTCWALRLERANAALTAAFVANLNSLVLDYGARQKVSGTHLSNFILKQLPVAPPDLFHGVCSWGSGTIEEWLLPYILELCYTSWDMQPFARDCGYQGPPFRWDAERRFMIRCEIDAAFFHLYLGTPEEWQHEPDALRRNFASPRAAVDHITDSFLGTKKKEWKAYGRYRTREMVLAIYDAMAEAVRTGVPYDSQLSPPAADERAAHADLSDTKPLVLPAGNRIQMSTEHYLLLVIRTTLEVAGGSMSTQRLLAVCRLLAMPDQLATRAEEFDQSFAKQWRRRFTDKLEPKLFMSTMRDLVERGAIRLVPSGGDSRTEWIDRTRFAADPEIQCDVQLALQVSATIAPAHMAELPELATPEEVRALLPVAA